MVADGALAPVQALLRWDPGWLAARELAERRELGFPPAARMAALTGAAAAVAELLAAARLPEGAEVLGPVPVGEDQERMLVRVRRLGRAGPGPALHDGAPGCAAPARAADIGAVSSVDPTGRLSGAGRPRATSVDTA